MRQKSQNLSRPADNGIPANHQRTLSQKHITIFFQTRDYIFDLNEDDSQAPLLNIYGGKLTTYRKLAENVLLALYKYIPANKKNSWTAKQRL